MMTDAGTDAGPAWADDERIQRILAVIAKETRIDQPKLRPDARIEDLGIASLDIVQSIFEIETEFDVEIPPIATNAGAEFAGRLWRMRFEPARSPALHLLGPAHQPRRAKSPRWFWPRGVTALGGSNLDLCRAEDRKRRERRIYRRERRGKNSDQVW